MKQLMWFICGLLVGLTALSMAKASIPGKSHVTDDTAIYQKLSELHVKKQEKLDFDSDITHLSQMEKRYQEKLPSLRNHPRLRGPLQRVSQQKYRYSGK